MSDWLHNLPIYWMALVVFGFTYLLAAGIYGLVTALAKGERARAFKAISPGMLPDLPSASSSGRTWSLPLLFRANRNRNFALSSAATLSKPQLRNGR